jgi:ketol-acid reductoisomerase
MKIYYDNDADPSVLAGKRIAVIGYGSQGFGHSNNLKDSGCDVVVGLRSDSPSVAKAQANGSRGIAGGGCRRTRRYHHVVDSR